MAIMSTISWTAGCIIRTVIIAMITGRWTWPERRLTAQRCGARAGSALQAATFVFDVPTEQRSLFFESKGFEVVSNSVVTKSRFGQGSGCQAELTD